MDFRNNQLILESGGCQTDEINKIVEINRPTKKNGGSFVDSLFKLEGMGSCPLLLVGLCPAIKDTCIT
jgi:hypothetical protein